MSRWDHSLVASHGLVGHPDRPYASWCSKLINILVPGTIPSRAIQEDMSDARRRHFFMMENQGLVVKAAKALGCVLVNIAPVDLVNGKVPRTILKPGRHAHTVG